MCIRDRYISHDIGAYPGYRRNTGRTDELLASFAPIPWYGVFFDYFSWGKVDIFFVFDYGVYWFFEGGLTSSACREWELSKLCYFFVFWVGTLVSSGALFFAELLASSILYIWFIQI